MANRHVANRGRTGCGDREYPALTRTRIGRSLQSRLPTALALQSNRFVDGDIVLRMNGVEEADRVAICSTIDGRLNDGKVAAAAADCKAVRLSFRGGCDQGPNEQGHGKQCNCSPS